MSFYVRIFLLYTPLSIETIVAIDHSFKFVNSLLFLEKEVSEEDEGSSSGASKSTGAAPPPVPSTKKPKMITLPEDQTAMQVDCGTFHTGWSLCVCACVCVCMCM